MGNKVKHHHEGCNCASDKMQETMVNCSWETNNAGEQTTIFASPGLCKVFASGTISYACNSSAASGIATVQFYRGTPDEGNLIAEYSVNEGSCLGFVASNFNTITVQTNEGPAQGEFCITANYKLPK